VTTAGSAVWLTILAVAAASAVIKATGPVLVGGRPLPPRALTVIALLSPALLAALVVTETFTEGARLVPVDARVAGVAVTGIALVARVPVLVAIALGPGTAALIRALA
jgi:uncharacterized membrane protein